MSRESQVALVEDREVSLNRDDLKSALDHIDFLESRISKLQSPPLGHAIVLDSKNEIDPTAFCNNDRVWVSRMQSVARICGPVDEETGLVEVMFSNMDRQTYQVGTHGKPGVRLLGKDDGTHVLIVIEGQLMQVEGVWGQEFHCGEVVKVNTLTKQIVEKNGMLPAGEIASVKKILDDKYIEIDIEGHSKIVFNGCKDVKKDDLVQMDPSVTVAIRSVVDEKSEEYTFDIEKVNVSWDEIGGCDKAKIDLQEAIELPFSRPEIYSFYNKRPPKGVLLYGPPGCGKTMLGKASATSLAKLHGADMAHAGMLYIKGPECLDKWVGNSERNVRNIFRRGTKFYEEYGVPLLVFVDEAESITSERGSGISSDMNKTIVPTWLSELDGLTGNHIILMLATNRPDLIDGAILREGRVDRHVYVGRPDIKTAQEIFKIHLANTPLKEIDKDSLSALICADLFSKHWALYRVVAKEWAEPKYLTMSDCVSGSLIAGIVDKATSFALRRDIADDSMLGATIKDFKDAIWETYGGMRGKNLSYEKKEFAEKHGTQLCSCSFENAEAEKP